MALKLENINNLIADDLDKRNENWTEIDNTFELKADKTEVDASLELKANKQQEAWITPTLLNGWIQGNPALKYRKDTVGNVYISGRIKSGTSILIFTLPSGYRPPTLYTKPIVSNWTIKYLFINTDGTVSLSSSTDANTELWVAIDLVLPGV